MSVYRSFASLLAIGIGLIAPGAEAKDAAPAPATADATNAAAAAQTSDAPTGDIVVSAQRRSESAQKLPLTITALSGDTLERQSIDSAVDVAKFAPNANAWGNDGRTRPRFYIRGIGNGNVSNNAVGAVSVSTDGVYLNSLALQGFPLLDLERVEVLSGPQGTLQGKNSTAGSIDFIARKPEFTDLNGYAKVSLGDYGQRQFESAAGAKINDTLAWRAAVRAEHQGGLATNRATDTQVGDFTDVAARLQLRARLADGAVDVLASGHYRNLDSTHTPFYAAIQSQSAPLAIGNRNYADSNLDDKQTLSAGGGFLRIDAQLPASLKLTSISSYDDGDRVEFLDGDYSTRELGRSYSRTKPQQVTQEIRLASPEGRFSWLLGGYYFHERLQSFASQATLNASSGGTPAYYYTQFTQYTNSAAVFGTARFDVLPTLHLQGGLRWTSDQTSIHLVSQRATSPVSFTGAAAWYLPGSTGQTLTDIARQDQSAHWNRATWDAAVRWDATRNITLYARAANGYRAGNFQGQVSATTPPVWSIPKR
jgi:iron complex outermembrane receptor protein